MTGAEVAQIILAAGTFVTALGGVIVSVFNMQKLTQVHETTNSLAERAEAMAHKLGVAQGVIQSSDVPIDLSVAHTDPAVAKEMSDGKKES